MTILKAGQYLGKTHSADLLPRRTNNHLPIIIFGCSHMFGWPYTNFNHIYALILLMISHFLAYSTTSYHGCIPILQVNRDASSHYDGSYHHGSFLLSLFPHFAHFQGNPDVGPFLPLCCNINVLIHCINHILQTIFLPIFVCILTVVYIPSGNQTWLAGQSTI